MSEEREEQPRLGLDEVARVVSEMAAERDLSALVRRFLETVRAWAAPSAVVAATREPKSESGWRLLPAVCLGSVPVGIERLLAGLVSETPACLERPTILRPQDEVAGVRPRDNCIVPWSCEGESGLLFLRGIPRPYPANLGEALLLASAALWPRLLGGPAARLESLVEELRAQARRLDVEATRQIERLTAARPTETAPPSDETVAPAQVETLTAELRTARAETERATRARQELAERLAGLQTAADLNRTERDAARAELAQLSSKLAAAEADRDAARAESQRVAAAHVALEEEAEATRTEVRRLTSQAAELEARHASGGEPTEEYRRAAEEAKAKATAAEDTLIAAQRELAVMRALGDPKELNEQLARLETALDTTRAERDRARADGDRIAAQSELLRSEHAATAQLLGELRRASEAAESRARTAEDALVALRGEIASTKAFGDQAQAHAKDVSARWDGALGALHLALAALRRAAFVPPGLRFSMEDASALLETKDERPATWLQIAILDRDPVGLEALAGDLEQAGLEVKIANYPEELGLLLRTPSARDLGAVVCDVMSFRPDQNVAGLFRSWEKDRPGLAYYLTYNPDNTGEMDRVRRIPQSLTAGHLTRPLATVRLVEALEVLARRRAQA